MKGWNMQGIVSWGLQLVVAGILLQTLFFKFTGAAESVYIFSTLGVEPWGRILSGIVELVAAILLLVPATTTVGAVLALAVMAGGDPAAFERIRPVLDTIGANVFLLGAVGSGSVAKLANNLIGLTTLVTAMEGMLLGIRNGLGADELRNVIMTASGAGPAVLGVAHDQLQRVRVAHVQ